MADALRATRRYRMDRWRRLRYQLGGGILIGALLPTLVRLWTLDANPEALANLYATFIGSALAIIIGVWLYRNITTYPGVEAGSSVLPAFSAAFALVLAGFVLLRLEYNRTPLLAGYVLSVGWFIVVNALIQARRILTIGVLPFGDIDVVERIRSVRWQKLVDPDADVSRFDAVAADLRSDLPDEWDGRLADYALAGVPVYHVKHLVESLTGRVQLEHLSENTFGSLAPISAFMTIKHLIDWLVALVAGLVLLPVLLLVALAVRLTSPGPALFRQQRIGYRGEPFIVFKFRTMHIHFAPPEAVREGAITVDDDPRVTRLGRFLRRSRIDELPQIWNVLRGEMSWIGPRPEARVLSDWYREQISFYRYRHIVRPGIAGWAQVCQGHVAHVDEVRAKLEYDFYYIKHFSPWIDLLIIVRTLRIMVSGFGAR